MSQENDYRSREDDDGRSDSATRTLIADESKDDCTTALTGNRTIDAHDAKIFKDEKTINEQQTVVGRSAGDDEESQQERADLGALDRQSTRTPVHSIFSTRNKRFIVFMTAWGGLFSPISANIYFAALNPLARDLHVSDSLINLT